MGKDSKIEWTDHTFNPWWGCTRVSPGCVNCYAESLAWRFGVGWGPKSKRRTFKPSHWQQPVAWNRQAEQAGVRFRVFCGSMCDVFEFGPPELNISREMLFDLIEHTPALIWMLLTKRPENIAGLIPESWGKAGWPANVWLGVSVEDQAAADRRIPVLLKHPARVHFLSCEPLLGPLDLRNYLSPCSYYCDHTAEGGGHYPGKGVNWVIVGGESGPAARPMHPAWAHSLRDQCARAGVNFFFKQWGEWALKGSIDAPSSDFGVLDPSGVWYHQHTGWNGRAIDPDTGEAYMVKIGKNAAGRLLDGYQWDETPNPYDGQQ